MTPYWNRNHPEADEIPEPLYDYSHLLDGADMAKRNRKRVNRLTMFCVVCLILGAACALHEAGLLW